MKWNKSNTVLSVLAAVLFTGLAIYQLSSQTQMQMEKAATENVREIVQIVEAGITEIRKNDVNMASHLAGLFTVDGDPKKELARLQNGSPFSRLSFVPAGSESGVGSDGREFLLSERPYGETVPFEDATVTDVYLSDFGAWTYTVCCPVLDGETPAGSFYADIIMERYDNILPDSIFQGKGLVYILDSNNLRFIYEPANTEVFISSKYDLHGFFNDFGILDEELEKQIGEAIADRKNIIVRMQLEKEPSYVYFWPVDRGEWYLCGIIPEYSVQSESIAVTRTIAAASTLIFFMAVLSCVLFFQYTRKRETERKYRIDLFQGIAKSIDDVVLLYDCKTGKQELAFDNIRRILGVDALQLGQSAEPDSEKDSGGGQNETLLELIKPETFREGKEISEKIVWSNPETGLLQILKVETAYVVLTGSKKCILSILDISKDERMQESLRASMLAAQNASRVKSDFLSQMSHEIRTPMNAVLGMAQIAKAKLGDWDRVADCLTKIEASSRHLLGLINDILDISKIESQKMSLTEEWISLEELLEGVKNIVSVQAAAKKQQFTIASDSDFVKLYADQVRLRQVLVNLLNNAVKYTPEGGHVSLTVEQRPSKLKEHCLMRFQIRDDGIGMGTEFMERLFTPFERENDQSVRAQTGTGLGLAIVQSLVSLMGGTVRVESEKGAGTVFYVDIEFRRQFPDHAPESPALEPETCDFGGDTILLAEDNELNREIALEFLRMANANVECASDGVEAFEKFRDSKAGHIRLILMDMQMPRWDGLEATRRIRLLDRPDAKTVPILAVTANAYSEDEQRCLAAGMDDHLSKPLEMQTFYRKISKYLNAGKKQEGEKP